MNTELELGKDLMIGRLSGRAASTQSQASLLKDCRDGRTERIIHDDQLYAVQRTEN